MSDPIVQGMQTSSNSLTKEIEACLVSVETSADNFDPRYILGVFRELAPLRKKITSESLVSVITSKYPESHPHRAALLSAVSSMDVEKFASEEISPEVDMFIHLLVQIFLNDNNRLEQLDTLNSQVVLALKSYNLRTLDFIGCKNWFYVSRCKELLKDLVPLRKDLLMALRTATLRHDTETRASIITLLLRNFLLTNDINQASNLVEKAEFPENAGTSLAARYYYYLARIYAIQLNYSLARECIISAIRKAPQSALGFHQAANKLSILIELLMGDIPELLIFRIPSFEKSLQPYLAVTRAVRLGNLDFFNVALSKYADILKKDSNYNLVLRLRQNVIKTGIRILSLSYSKISLKDVCIKLHIDSEASAEYIVAKAIRDGVIDATIDSENGFMKSNELVDVYSSKEPQSEFDQRIKFCMQVHNENVKAMRYPMSNNRIDLKADAEAREKEQEILAYLQDGDFGDFL